LLFCQDLERTSIQIYILWKDNLLPAQLKRAWFIEVCLSAAVLGCGIAFAVVPDKPGVFWVVFGTFTAVQCAKVITAITSSRAMPERKHPVLIVTALTSIASIVSIVILVPVVVEAVSVDARFRLLPLSFPPLLADVALIIFRMNREIKESENAQRSDRSPVADPRPDTNHDRASILSYNTRAEGVALTCDSISLVTQSSPQKAHYASSAKVFPVDGQHVLNL